MKLGKKEARIDPRTIKLSSIIKPELLPPLPDSFDFDRAFPNLVFPSGNDYGNFDHGACVPVTKYLWQMRAEAVEQGRIIPITRNDVLAQYFSETGGMNNDYGLVMLDSFRDWRRNGIRINGRKFLGFHWGGHKYKIHAFAKIDAVHIEEVKAAIYLLYGMPTGLLLPATAQDQWDRGDVWDVVDKPGNEPGTWGGHAVNTYVYTAENVKTDKYWLECYTWGKRQVMSYDFLKKYCDECYGIVDKKDRPDSPIDEEKLEGFLNVVSK